MRARFRLLFFHSRIESSRINRDALQAQRILCQVQRKTIGVIEFESRFTVEAVTF